MYYTESRSSEILEMLPIAFGVMIGLVIVLLIINALLKNKDSKKELITCRATVTENLGDSCGTAWYIMETENGQRIKLRSFQTRTLLLMVGDRGIVKYRGETLEDFQREIN